MTPDRHDPPRHPTITVLEIRQDQIRVDRMDALDRTPVIDLKPVLRPRPRA